MSEDMNPLDTFKSNPSTLILSWILGIVDYGFWWNENGRKMTGGLNALSKGIPISHHPHPHKSQRL